MNLRDFNRSVSYVATSRKTNIRKVLNTHNISPVKRSGQNSLVSTNFTFPQICFLPEFSPYISRHDNEVLPEFAFITFHFVKCKGTLEMLLPGSRFV